MITIDGLTPRQVELLDTMWAIDGYAEYMEWKSTQNQQEIELLESMIAIAEIDEIVENEGFAEAAEVLSMY